MNCTYKSTRWIFQEGSRISWTFRLEKSTFNLSRTHRCIVHLQKSPGTTLAFPLLSQVPRPHEQLYYDFILVVNKFIYATTFLKYF